MLHAKKCVLRQRHGEKHLDRFSFFRQITYDCVSEMTPPRKQIYTLNVGPLDPSRPLMAQMMQHGGIDIPVVLYSSAVVKNTKLTRVKG